MKTLTIIVNSQYGNSIEQVECKNEAELQVLKNRYRRVHANDGASVSFSNHKRCYFEQVV